MGARSQPTFLARLTVKQAVAPRDVGVLVIAAVLGGAAILFLPRALVFGPVLQWAPRSQRAERRCTGSGLLARSSGACLIAGIGLLTIANAAWAHAIGVRCLLGFVLVGFLAIRAGGRSPRPAARIRSSLWHPRQPTAAERRRDQLTQKSVCCPER